MSHVQSQTRDLKLPPTMAAASNNFFTSLAQIQLKVECTLLSISKKKTISSIKLVKIIIIITLIDPNQRPSRERDKKVCCDRTRTASFAYGGCNCIFHAQLCVAEHLSLMQNNGWARRLTMNYAL